MTANAGTQVVLVRKTALRERYAPMAWRVDEGKCSDPPGIKNTDKDALSCRLVMDRAQCVTMHTTLPQILVTRRAKPDFGGTVPPITASPKMAGRVPQDLAASAPGVQQPIGTEGRSVDAASAVSVTFTAGDEQAGDASQNGTWKLMGFAGPACPGDGTTCTFNTARDGVDTVYVDYAPVSNLVMTVAPGISVSISQVLMNGRVVTGTGAQIPCQAGSTTCRFPLPAGTIWDVRATRAGTGSPSPPGFGPACQPRNGLAAVQGATRSCTLPLPFLAGSETRLSVN